MKYRIKFTSGSLSGRDFGFAKNTISIGRSRQNDVVLTEPDVSARHIILYLAEHGIEMENLSSRITIVDAEPMKLGERKKITAGMSVRLGDEVSWELEAVEDSGAASDDQPTGSAFDDLATGFPDDEKTGGVLPDDRPGSSARASAPEPSPADDSPAVQAEPPVEPAGNDETIMMQTRMASPEELEYLKSSHDKERKKRIGFLLFTGVAIVAALFLVYRLFVYREPEEFVSWPKKSNGKIYYNIAQLKDIPFTKDCDIEYPATPGAKVINEDGRVTIIAAIGKYLDVPLRIVVEYRREPQLLTTSRTAIFEKWIAAKSRSGGNWNFDLILPVEFFSTDHGIPFLQVTYSRTVKSDAYFGIAVFWRHEDWCFFMTKEVPMRERWRAEYFLRGETFLWFSDAFLNDHWEGHEDLLPGSAAANLDEAKTLLSRRTPSVWKKCELLLNSALIKSCGARDDTYRFALAQLRQLRQQQREWFNAQKIAYFCAKNAKLKGEQKQIKESVKADFSSDDDLRYYKIRRNKWE